MGSEIYAVLRVHLHGGRFLRNRLLEKGVDSFFLGYLLLVSRGKFETVVFLIIIRSSSVTFEAHWKWRDSWILYLDETPYYESQLKKLGLIVKHLVPFCCFNSETYNLVLI